MEFLRAFIGFILVVAISILLGWTKNYKSPATFTYSWLFAILLLLAIRFFI